MLQFLPKAKACGPSRLVGTSIEAACAPAGLLLTVLVRVRVLGLWKHPHEQLQKIDPQFQLGTAANMRLVAMPFVGGRSVHTLAHRSLSLACKHYSRQGQVQDASGDNASQC